MALAHQVVIETATGDALRDGYCVFEAADGSFDGATESVRTDASLPVKVRGDEDEAMMDRWNGSAWVEATQPGGDGDFLTALAILGA